MRTPSKIVSGMGHVLVAQVVMKRFEVQPAFETRDRQQRLQLGREVQRAVMLPVVQRLLSHPVARQQSDLLAAVPDRHREHAVDVLGQALAMVFPEMRQQLGIGVRVQLMAASEERRTRNAESCRARRSAPRSTVPSSLVSGWRPPATSMMLRRAAPIANSFAGDDVLIVRTAVMQRGQHRRHGVAIAVAEDIPRCRT